MPTAFTRTLTALALLLVACAQIFGMDRGFLCDCGGIEKITRVDHCHGPHSAACHQDEDEAQDHDHALTPHHHDESDPQSGEDTDTDTHEHQALIESLLASLSPGFEFSAPPAIIIGWVMPEWQSPVIDLAALTSTPEVAAADPPQATHRPWPRVLARTVALRI